MMITGKGPRPAGTYITPEMLPPVAVVGDAVLGVGGGAGDGARRLCRSRPSRCFRRSAASETGSGASVGVGLERRGAAVHLGVGLAAEQA